MNPRLVLRNLQGIGVQASFIIARYTKIYSILSIATSMLFSSLLILVLIPSGLEAVFAVGILIMLAYLAGTIQLAISLASELESGETILYLSTPLSRLAYVASWILSALILTVGLFLMAIIVPAIAIDPGLVSQGSFLGMTFALSGEILYYISALTLVSIVSKRRSIVQAAAFALFILGPIIVFIGVLIYDSIAAGGVDEESLVKAISIFHPVILSITSGGGFLFNRSVVYSVVSSAIIIASSIYYTIRRFEV